MIMLVILAVIFTQGRTIFLNSIRNMPDTTVTESTEWGTMPYLTVCVDADTRNTIPFVVALVVSGFQREHGAGFVGAECTSTEGQPVHVDTSDLVTGEHIPGNPGCQLLDLRDLKPEFGQTANSLVIAGLLDNPERNLVEPKFVTYFFSEEPPTNEEMSHPLHEPGATLFTTPKYLNKEAMDLSATECKDESIPRFDMPVYQKTQFPSYEAWRNTNLTDRLLWGTSSDRSPHVTKYSATGNGKWDACLPDVVLDELRQDLSTEVKLSWLCNGAPVFSFGLLVEKPTVTKLSFVAPAYSALRVASLCSVWVLVFQFGFFGLIAATRRLGLGGSEPPPKEGSEPLLEKSIP
jgi:hypothetical protein